MNSTDPFQLEDQTDEDFFDKLVGDDEFGLAGSGSASGEIVRAFSSMSIGHPDSSEDGSKEQNRQEDEGIAGLETLENINSIPEKIAPIAVGNSLAPQESLSSGDRIKALADVGSPGSSAGMSAGSKGTGIKEVQWTAFSSGQGILDMGGSGAYSDFFSEVPAQSANQTLAGADNKIAFSDPIAPFEPRSQSGYLNSSQQLEAQTTVVQNDQVSTANGTEYWENAYPGWKYDANTGEWYQIDGYDSSNAQLSAYSSTVETNQETSQGIAQPAYGSVPYGQDPEISYLQQTTQSVAESIPEEISNKNFEYPPNMVFDPQYPGWYYDTNTSQWYSLESYAQSVQTTSDELYNQQAQEPSAPDASHPAQNSSFYGKEAEHSQPFNQEQGDWSGYNSSYQQVNMWQPKEDIHNESASSLYDSQHQEWKLPDQATQFVPSSLQSSVNSFSESNYQVGQPRTEHNYFMNQNPLNYSQFTQSGSGRSLEGRPPHALVTFGFGGKLIVMKDTTYGNQEAAKGEIKILNLAEVAAENSDSSTANAYFHALCRQPFPGPLVGGNPSTKDLNKWIDERLSSFDLLTMDGRKAELSKLLLSLLKICCQYYGKLRSPFGADSSLLEADSPDLAVTQLFSSAKKRNQHSSEYGDVTHCMCNLPSEAQIRGTALEVQNLLVSGRRKEALQRAQDGQLWGPALVLAAQLGDKFYVETVKQMAHRQFASGSPLRTLCLLIAGQPADVFSGDNFNNNMPGLSPGGMLDDWEENLAIIAGNRTKDDELVIINLGDCLWKETGEVTAAHMCYLVAEAKFEAYSDKARMCLVGADHWRCPRTYASPEAIQRTELYEYSKVTGNSQFVLQPFQPYKLVYAHMLAEVGKVSDSLKYCQAITKSLKSSGRDPEVEAWKGMVSSLEERLRAHLQGGYSTNLAPGKLVGKLFTSIDRSLHRMIGAPPSLPPLPPGHVNSHEHDSMSMMSSKIGNDQSAMSMSALVSSASVETISGWTGDSRKTIHSRSVSEPDFGRSPKQEQINAGTKSSTPEGQSKTQGGSRFGLFGTQFIQKTVGWMSRSRQAKLGESNKFYYDEKLKRWVEEGAELAAEPGPPPPPPTATAFSTAAAPPSGFGSSNSTLAEHPPLNGISEVKFPNSMDQSQGVPPVPPTMNQFSARGRVGVRSRYVDTFNKGVASTPAFQAPSLPLAKPMGGAKFFVPTPAAAEEPADGPSASSSSSSSSLLSSSSSSSSAMQRFPSMDNISSTRKSRGMGGSPPDSNSSLASRTRALSWSGTYPDPSSLSSSSSSAVKPPVPQFFSPNNGPFPRNLANGGGFGDDLQEVEL